MGEKWRQIEGYPGYEVSSLGRVRSWRAPGAVPTGQDFRWRKTPKVLSLFVSHGYSRVNIRDADGNNYKPVVHFLVASTFLGPAPDPGMTVAHCNGDQSDNRLENLRWATHQENCEDKKEHGTHRRGEDISTAKLLESDVRMIRRLVSEGVSNRELSRRYHVSTTTIRRIAQRKSWAWVPEEPERWDDFVTELEQEYDPVPF